MKWFQPIIFGPDRDSFSLTLVEKIIWEYFNRIIINNMKKKILFNKFHNFCSLVFILSNRWSFTHPHTIKWKLNFLKFSYIEQYTWNIYILSDLIRELNPQCQKWKWVAQNIRRFITFSETPLWIMRDLKLTSKIWFQTAFVYEWSIFSIFFLVKHNNNR